MVSSTKPIFRSDFSMRTFDEKTMAVLKMIREQSLREDADDSIPAGRKLYAIPFESGWFLYSLVRLIKPRLALEIGMSAGMSTIFIARAITDSWRFSVASHQSSAEDSGAEKLGHLAAGKLYTMEYDERKLALGRKNLEEVGLLDSVEIIEGDAKVNVKKLEGNFEFVFNDAEKVDYLYFIKELERVTRVGSVVISDNAISHRQALGNFFSYLTESEKWLSQTIPIGNGLEMSLRVG